MAGYSSENNWEDHNDDDYYSAGDWGDEQDDGDYYSDDHHEQQDFDDYDSVDGELYYKEQDNDEKPHDHLEDLDYATGSYEETDGEYAYYEEGDDNDERSYEGYYEGTVSDDNYYEEQEDDNDMASDDEYQGEEAEESDKEPEGYLGGYGAVQYPQQTMTRGIVSNQDNGGGHLVMGYQWSSRIRHQDKQTNSYGLTNTKHTFSSGDKFKERSTGRVGFKDEQKWSSTIRVGDRNWYSEYQLEERFRNVRFGDSSGSGSNGNGHRLTSNNCQKY